MEKKKIEQKVEPPLTAKVQKYRCFQNFPLGQYLFCYLVSGEVLVKKEFQQLHYFISVHIIPVMGPRS
jgi:hypothetical protein